MPEPTRATIWAGALASVPAVAAAALASVPGFGVLDYHACLAIAPVTGACAAATTIVVLRGQSSWLPRLLTGACFGPLLVLLGVSLWIPVCDYPTGLTFYLLGPLCSGVVGALMATAAVRLKVAWAGRLVVLANVVLAVPPLWFFCAHPQAFGFHPLLGWVAGPLYEDAVAPGWTAVSVRLLDLAAWSALATLRQHRLAKWLAVTTLCVAALRAGPDGWLVSTAQVEQHLSERIVEDGLVLHVHRGARNAALWAEDFAFRYSELTTFFGDKPKGTIHAYIYPDSRTKGRLMGAERVELAKPWLRQVHIVSPGYGSSIVSHELAHVFAADHVDGAFGVPMRGGLVPDALLIEGLAVAAEWPIRQGMTVHQWAKAMRLLKLAPSVQSLVSPTGFFAQSGARAYTIAGSYLRFVRDRHGVEEMLRLYRHATVGAWLGEWEVFIDSAQSGPLTAAQVAFARARFERPAMFFRTCALHAGRRFEEASRARRLGRHNDAFETLKRLHNAVGSVASGLSASRLSIAAERATEGQAIVDKLENAGLLQTALRKGAAQLLRGDLLWADGERSQARRRWRIASAHPAGIGTRRALAARLASHDAAALLIEPGWQPWHEMTLERHTQAPGDPVVRYLAGRAWLLRTPTPDGLDMPSVATALAARGDDVGLLRREALRLNALLAAHEGRCDEVAASEWRDKLMPRCLFIRKRRTDQGQPQAPYQSGRQGRSLPSGT